ncbi:MAG TPA: glycosyltransferase [Candidatus Acidoferrales bacterium]|nr:glycosyltransferase [Candidatus Acidoferrales bacterium]
MNSHTETERGAPRVLHVSPFFVPAWCYGGMVESAYQASRHLARSGAAVRVLTTDANGPGKALDAESMSRYAHGERFEVTYCPRVARQSVSPAMLVALTEHVRWADIVHLHAAYSFPTIPTLLAARMLKRPVVWSPHGALQRWDRSRRTTLKSLWDKLCRLVAPERLTMQVTSEQEAVETRARFAGATIALVTNGVEVPATVNRPPRGPRLRLGFLGRLDPKKGVENLLAACRIVKDKRVPAFSLEIAGAGTREYEERLRGEIARRELESEVTMLGDIRGTEKQRMLERTDVLVVPSYTENFGNVIAEALAHGAGVIASTGTPWSELERRGCGLWVSNEPASLALAIEAMSLKPLEEVSERARRWMAEEFSWERRAVELLAIYNAALVQQSGPILTGKAAISNSHSNSQ